VAAAEAGPEAPTGLLVGATALQPRAKHADGGLVEIGGETFYRIVHHDAMPPFLMTVASDSNLWLFISSNGALTAGRGSPENALFPYYPDDRIHDGQDQVGGKTILRVTRGSRTSLWEPLSQRFEGMYRVTRSVAKSAYGNKVRFDEVNHDLGLTFSVTWMTSDRHGCVRRAALENLGRDAVAVELLDGVQNLLPAGLTRAFQLEFSTLADAYKESELETRSGLALLRFAAIPTDRNEPSESLRTTTAWSEGLRARRHLLCSAQLDRFRRGDDVDEETLIRGRRGAFFVQSHLDVEAGEVREWSVVADVGQDAVDVAGRIRLLTSGADLRAELDADIRRGTEKLVRIVACADGLQLTEDRMTSWRHFSNALFNAMRGGVPDAAYAISRDDFRSFVTQCNRPVAQRCAAFLAGLPAVLPHASLLELSAGPGDPDLERLAHEYLPLTFSRRHGDPSRPWNTFNIEIDDAGGRRILDYQGDWRDIFQNWEALAQSFPGYLESMIFKFVDSSTLDGYNGRRVSRDGFEWEVPDPDNAWAHIGYWGDHQVIYLLRLLESSARYHPRALQRLLRHRAFTYADIPYRIKPHAAMMRDPFETILFDGSRDGSIRKRVESVGSDGKLLCGGDGKPSRATLAEKLLVVALARLFNFIPEAGLWMNTQRPEWNDANNALAGRGVSVVTLCHLRRFLAFCRRLFSTSGARAFEVSAEVATAMRQILAALRRHAALLDGPISDQQRQSVLQDLGTVGSGYRAGLYRAGFSGEQIALGVVELEAFCDIAVRHIDHSIVANRRSDGLYHAYNLMEVADNGISIRRLDVMLEGQVAVLVSGALSPRECADLLDSLRASPLYREDQNTYLLYPDRRLPGFLGKNRVPAELAAGSRALTAMLETGDRRVVVRDVDGVVHFRPEFGNRNMLAHVLAGLSLSEPEMAEILSVYEAVFHHRSFTGRSGSMYKYEGLGCVYWHMVSKLLLAAQEAVDAASRDGRDPASVERLRRHYEEIRAGLGVHKSAEQFGAIPLDPYSHTPGFAGAQQPGMTGQVKEDLLTRFGELGVSVEGGRLTFRQDLATPAEFLAAETTFHFVDVEGEQRSLQLEPGTLAFTTCQVPIVAHRSGPARIELTLRDGPARLVEALTLDPAASRAIYERNGEVRRLDVFWGMADSPSQ
jgi:hypothetical protein